MKIFDVFKRDKKTAAAPKLGILAQGWGGMFGQGDDFNDFARGGNAKVTVEQAMENTAVFRCVSLISYAIAMLPLHIIDGETKEKARENPLFKLLHAMPNDWQTAFNFRAFMQRNALVHGNAYALVIRSMGRIIKLIPLDPQKVEVKQKANWAVEYHYAQEGGNAKVIKPQDMLHIYADSADGLTGSSMVKGAAKAISLAMELERSQLHFFKNGMLMGGMLTHPDKLSPEAHERLKASMNDEYRGSANAGKWLIGEEGLNAQQFTSSARDSQQMEARALQIEEIGRVFGVPRPFLGLDDTSWGSGIDVLGQIFVRYALNPWFSAWEQAIKRACMNEVERERLEVKFNAGALLRGSMKDQAEFFAKALGSGGHQPWMDYAEVRETMDLPEREIAANPLMNKDKDNEPETVADD